MSDRSQLISTGTPFQYDQKRDAEFERLIKRYPTRESMILPALWLIQEQEGWISQEAIAYVADRIGTFASKVYEAVTFYTMYQLQPMGKNHICVCRTLSCRLRGAEEVLRSLPELPSERAVLPVAEPSVPVARMSYPKMPTCGTLMTFDPRAAMSPW